MRAPNSQQLLRLSLITLCLEIAIASAGRMPVRAQSPSAPPAATIISVVFEPPPGDDTPNGTSSGGSRSGGHCSQPANSDRLPIPLLPQSNRGLTIAAHPSFLVYIPPTSASRVFFSLQTENGENFYQTILPIPQSNAVISFNFKADAPPLEVGKTYRWSLAILCDDRLDPNDPFVQGWIERIEPNASLLAQLQEGNTLEQAALYGKAGLWYDTVSTLAQVRRSQPDDPVLANTWTRFLASVGLDAIASEALQE